MNKRIYQAKLAIEKDENEVIKLFFLIFILQTKENVVQILDGIVTLGHSAESRAFCQIVL
ncbi:hypothetical protein [Streptococcus ovuberis]|uniref:Uncharacterized protein n=1 Tax=Streptococcus ovuberis TaxID=1936207 RepID=A0A7X6MZT0_9STRE|nr:hypothetical protein [Streptococcus ovuberis]NKZ20813.1 hypothetical protein [Streptococcus ovuberis]